MIDGILTSESIPVTVVCMRTTLDLPEDLVNEAKTILGFKSKTDTIVYALNELVRRKKRRDLVALFGTITFDLDADELRGKPRRHERPVK